MTNKEQIKIKPRKDKKTKTQKQHNEMIDKKLKKLNFGIFIPSTNLCEKCCKKIYGNNIKQENTNSDLTKCSHCKKENKSNYCKYWITKEELEKKESEKK